MTALRSPTIPSIWAGFKSAVTWVSDRISPMTVGASLKFAHKALAGLEKAEAKALAETQKLDAKIVAHTASKEALADTAATASRVAANLRALIA